MGDRVDDEGCSRAFCLWSAAIAGVGVQWKATDHSNDGGWWPCVTVHLEISSPLTERIEMTPLPVDDTARRRLQAAQRAEAEALKAVELAARACDRVQRKVDEAITVLNAAKCDLVSVSGPTRAALLLAEDEADLRRLRRAALPLQQ